MGAEAGLSEYDVLLDDLCAEPDNWVLRGILADWYEDAGEGMKAECLAWSSQNHKRAHQEKRKGSDNTEVPLFVWFDASKVAPNLGDTESDLPGELFKHLGGGKAVANHMLYKTRREAEEALVAAWVAARAAGWTPA